MTAKQVDVVVQSVEDFVKRASAWIESTLPSIDDPPIDDQELQRLLFDAGFAGIAYPVEYGGAGLTLEHHKAFYDLADDLGRQVRPSYKYQASPATIGPTMLEHASNETNLRFLPGMLRGDQVWVQLLSEPRGGSDMAGAITQLTADGDNYVLNGSKMWTSGARQADWGFVLCRSNWDLPKHEGLSVIALPLKGTPGLTIRQTRMADGELGEFCEEFFDDVMVPREHLIGQENQGWAIARTLLLHERNYHGNIRYGYGRDIHPDRPNAQRGSQSNDVVSYLLDIAGRRGTLREFGDGIADVYIESVVGSLTQERINSGISVGSHEGPWGSVLKLRWAVDHQLARTQLSVLGAQGLIWEGDGTRCDGISSNWLMARVRTIAGGTNEMQRNTISERLLGLPKDIQVDQNKPYREVQKSRAY